MGTIADEAVIMDTTTHLPEATEMTILSEDEAKALADQYLDCDHIQNPREETTKADELYQFWKWNPPAFAAGKPEYWGEWKVFRLIDPQAGDEGIHKLSADMAHYFVERSETDRDYWDAVCRIIADMLDQSSSSARIDPCLCAWLIGMLRGDRVAPKKRRGNPARKYHVRDGLIYFAMEALCDKGSMNQVAASAWIGERVNLSKEAVASIYRKACLPS